jgi:hypothetical protein
MVNQDGILSEREIRYAHISKNMADSLDDLRFMRRSLNAAQIALGGLFLGITAVCLKNFTEQTNLAIYTGSLGLTTLIGSTVYILRETLRGATTCQLRNQVERVASANEYYVNNGRPPKGLEEYSLDTIEGR